jgi:hypothetical protein
MPLILQFPDASSFEKESNGEQKKRTRKSSIRILENSETIIDDDGNDNISNNNCTLPYPERSDQLSRSKKDENRRLTAC